MKSLRSTVAVLSSLLWGVAAASERVTADLEGAWDLVSYSTADGAPESAAGLQLMKDGHFSIAYDMQFAGGEPSARMHAGTYRVDGNRITYDVQWWVQHVEGEGAILTSVQVSPEFEYDGTDLKLEFASGSRQHWRRTGPAAD